MSNKLMTYEGVKKLETTDDSKLTARRRATKKLIQVAVLAAALVPLSAVSVEAETISCLFSTTPSDDFCTSDDGGVGFRSGATASYVFNGGPFSPGGYSVFLDFGAGDILGDFFVAFTNEELSQDDPLWDERLANFPNHICVPIAGDPITGAPDLCVFLRAETDAPLPNGPLDPGPDTWNVDDRYDLFVRWNADTTGLHGENPHLLHANISCGPGDTGCSDDVFDRDITNPETYTACPPDCEEIELFKAAGDPGVGGDDDNFGGFTITATVPEPATVFLLVTGIASLAYRKRSRRPRAE